MRIGITAQGFYCCIGRRVASRGKYELKGLSQLPGSLDKIEILGYGQQFIAAGVHPTGARIQWRKNAPLVPREKLQPVTEAQVAAFLKDAAPVIGADMTRQSGGASDAGARVGDADLVAVDFDALAAIVAKLPNGPAFDDRNRFVAVAYALAAAFPDDEGRALGLWQAWCDRWHRGSQNEGEIEGVWELAPDDEHHVGADWLITQALGRH